MKFKYFVKDVWFFWLIIQKTHQKLAFGKKIPIFHCPEE
jgi:hypothetical protein